MTDEKPKPRSVSPPVGAYLVLVVVVVSSTVSASRDCWREPARPALPETAGDEHSPAEFPDVLAAGSVETQQRSLSASLGFDLGGMPRVRAFALREREDDYWVAFYRERGDIWTVLSPVHAPTGYHAPRLVGDPPALHMSLRRADIDFRFRLDGESVVFEPAPPLGYGHEEILVP